jgi:pimeloyl-ACP methyl ester carboxylesterase
MPRSFTLGHNRVQGVLLAVPGVPWWNTVLAWLQVLMTVLTQCRDVNRRAGFTALAVVVAVAGAAQTADHMDRSPHQIRFVDVEKNVRLEVLEWGGSGRAVILLAGAGNTAHVYDDFAPKLRSCCQVYGITRRGYGASDRPPSGYGDQRLADDVFQVLRKLRIDRPVLVGHSMAGGEITTIGNQHSDLLAGLVYLDALGDPRDWPGSDPAYRALANQLPEVRWGPPAPDRSSFSAYRKSQLRDEHYAFPESELRQMFVANEDGSVGTFKTDGNIHSAVGAGQKKRDYSNIKVPVLAMFEYPRSRQPPSARPTKDPETDKERVAREAYVRATAAYVDRWVQNLKSGVPNARIVDLQGAGHFVFLSRETEVLNEIRYFVAGIR